MKQLEEEFKKLKDPLEKTLLDVRGLINSVENPFNLIFSDASYSEGKNVTQRREAFREAGGQNDARARLEREDRSFGSYGSLNRFVNVLTAVNLMILLVGREQLQSLINLLTWKNLLDKELAEIIREAMAFLTSPELGLKPLSPQRNPPAITDIITVMYLISKIARDSDDSFITVLLFAYEPIRRFLELKGWGGGGG